MYTSVSADVRAAGVGLGGLQLAEPQLEPWPYPWVARSDVREVVCDTLGTRGQ